MLRNTVQTPKQFYVKGKIIFGILFLIIISLFTIYVSINVGPYEISKRETFNFFLNYLGFKNHLISDTQIAIIQTVRLPRILMAFVVGGGLSVSGVIMQALFRNNLADPSIIGVSAGGATGAVFAIFTGIAVLSVWAIPFFAFLGSFILGALGFITGLWAEKFDHTATITNFIVTPLSFVSGVFYSVDRLPAFFQSISKINPFFFIIDITRFGFLGVSDGSIIFGLFYLIILAFAMWFLSYYLYKIGYKIKS